MFLLLLILSVFVIAYAPATRMLNRAVAGLVYDTRRSFR